jgi:outer membrane protein TolC
MENLKQAERNLLYEIRDFTRFRKDYSVQIATAYYGVLGNRDTVRNSYQNLQSSQKNAERTRALAADGRIAQAELGRLEQQQLSVEAAWVNAVRTYRQALDDFKIQIGLPVEANLVLDDSDLESLQIRHPDISVDDAIRVALATRLDRMNTNDQYVDATRRSEVARNFLKPQVDLVASTEITSGPDTARGVPLPDPARYSWNAGLDLDLPLDRKSERNQYRQATLFEDRARRDLDLLEDRIRLQVRDGWRTLEQARRSYEIAEVGVKIAQRRVEEQALLAELGRAKAQDQVDAQNALNDSRNQRTQALVNHTITRLQFWNNMGILFIRENGKWEEGAGPRQKSHE